MIAEKWGESLVVAQQKMFIFSGQVRRVRGPAVGPALPPAAGRDQPQNQLQEEREKGEIRIKRFVSKVAKAFTDIPERGAAWGSSELSGARREAVRVL